MKTIPFGMKKSYFSIDVYVDGGHVLSLCCGAKPPSHGSQTISLATFVSGHPSRIYTVQGEPHNSLTVPVASNNRSTTHEKALIFSPSRTA